MKTRELIVTCQYSEEDRTASQLIRRSFELFLQKELQEAGSDPSGGV